MTEEVKLTTTQAREEIERGLRTFRAFENLHSALLNLESLEQNLAETTARVASMKANEAEALKQRNDSDNSIKDAILKAAQIRKNAEEEAKAIAADARVSASKVLGDAKEEAKKMKLDAQGELDGLLTKSADLKSQHIVLDASLKEKNAELEVVSHTLKTHRESLEKFLKG